MEEEKEIIWILEDDESCRDILELTLGKSFNLIFFPSLILFYEHLDNPVRKTPVMMLADLNLEDGNFVDFLESKRRDEISRDIPLTIISADDDADTLRQCFKLGVHDYLTKPFKRNELLVKVETQLAKSNVYVGKIKTFIEVDGNKIEGLTTKERKLFNLFIATDPRIIDREQILKEVWGGRQVHPKSVDVHIYNLRRKINDQGYVIKSLGNGKWSLLSSRLDPSH